MKNATAILLLALLIFNLAGYRLMFGILQEEHKISLEAGLDKNEYSENDLFEIRVPFSMPYLPAQTSFERVDGEVTVDGLSYKYVKRRIEKGQLILLCLRDDKKTGIDRARTVFGAGVNEFPSTGKKSPVSSRKLTLPSEYEEIARQAPPATPLILLCTPFERFAAELTPGYTRFAERPPQVC